MEQARRPALAHHVHRTAPMGPRVLINGIWYQTNLEIILSSQGALASWPRAGVEHFDHSVDSRCPYPANIVLQTNIADEKIVDIDVATVPASFSIPAAARRYGRSRVIAACSVRNGSGSVPADAGCAGG